MYNLIPVSVFRRTSGIPPYKFSLTDKHMLGISCNMIKVAYAYNYQRVQI